LRGSSIRLGFTYRNRWHVYLFRLRDQFPVALHVAPAHKKRANRTMNVDLRSYSRHWLTEFIEQYQEEECLWQPKHNDYSNHAARNKSYDRLVEKLKEVEPNPDRAMVVR